MIFPDLRLGMFRLDFNRSIFGEIMTVTEHSIHVCILSEHNVAEYLAVKTLRPREVFAVASKVIQEGDHSRHTRFKETVEKYFQEIKVKIVGGSIIGHDYAETLTWAQKDLLPVLGPKKKDGARLVLNVTGGTKILVLALLNAPEPGFWDELHYSPFRHDQAQSELERIIGADVSKLSLADITPLEQASLYTSHFSVESIDPKPELAGMLWEAYQNIQSPYWHWSKFLQRWWYGEGLTDQERQAGATEDKHFIRFPQKFCQACCLNIDWLAAFFDISPDCVCIPTRNGSEKDRVRWFAGRWYEELLVQWLLEDGIDPAHIISNIRIKGSDEDPGNEGDVLVQRNQRLYLLEVKVGDQSEILKTDNVNKLASAADYLGKVSAAFMLTENVNANSRFKAFFEHAKAKDIRILKTREDLRSWLRLKKNT